MKTLKLSLAAIPLALGFGAGVQAALNAVDPGPYVVENGFFPAWYQDTDAVALDLCLSGANIPARSKIRVKVGDSIRFTPPTRAKSHSPARMLRTA